MTLSDAALGSWLAPRLGASSVEVIGFDVPKSGFSAETVFADLVVDGTPRRVVVRREVPDPAVYPQQAPGLDVEVDIQWRVMEALHAHSSVPLAPLVGYEADPVVLGAPFFVMGLVLGDVPTESPPYTESGFFVDATPEARTRMMRAGTELVAAVHAVDWRAAGLSFLADPAAAPGTETQLALWTSYAERELRGREHPLMAEGLAWLHAHPRGDEGPVGLLWGDPRPGNVIWDTTTYEPLCATDFEAAAIGAPEQDIGWWLMFDRTMHPTDERLPGDLTRDEQRAHYFAAAARPEADTSWHEVFAAYRYAAIVGRVMNRLEDRGDMPAGHTIWLENPATIALAALLEEVG